MIIHSLYRDYEASFTSNYVDELKGLAHSYVVIDRHVYDLYSEKLAPLFRENRVFLLDVMEENKTIEKALEIVDELVKLPTKRNTVLIAIGGGITQDVCCFVASVLYRGIEWYFVPTTLLAQTDSCIGSKSSINYGTFKNLLGTFYPPSVIRIDPAFLHTLTRRDYLSGLGEIFKVAIMRGKEDFYAIRERLEALLNGDDAVLHQEIEKTLTFKKSVIEIDEFDRDYRNIMNYGHTFGHALEAESAFAIPHGQGVSIGLMISNEISLHRGLIQEAYRNDMRDTMRQIIQPEIIPAGLLRGQTLLPAMRKDKKFLGQMHTCILVDEQCAQKYKDVTDEEICSAVQEIDHYLFKTR